MISFISSMDMKSSKSCIIFLKGLRFLLWNLFFFIPKRKVEIEINDSTALLHKVEKKWLDAFNQELEKIYKEIIKAQKVALNVLYNGDEIDGFAPIIINGNYARLLQEILYYCVK